MMPTTIAWLGLGAWVLFIVGIGVALVVTYKSGHASGREQERARWMPRIRALTAQVDDLRLQAPPPGPWVQLPPARPVRAILRPGWRDAVDTTGGMRALTDAVIAEMEAGTWPPAGESGWASTRGGAS
jgi:hypothetical protein